MMLRLPAPTDAAPARDKPVLPRSSTTADETSGDGSFLADANEKTFRRYLAISALSFVILFGLVWVYMLTMPMAYLSRDYPRWIAKRSLLASCDVGSVSIFGDSRAFAAIEPKQLPFKASNFAFPGSTPIEGLFAVQGVLRCTNHPEAVVIGYSAGQFMQDQYYWDGSVESGLLNFSETRQVQEEGEALHDNEIPALRAGDHLAPLIREALYAVRFPPLYFSSLVNAFVFGRYAHNYAAELQIRANRGQGFMGTAAGSDALAGEALFPKFVLSPLVDAYFTKMLSALAQAKIPVVILSLPINDATCRVTNPALRTGFVKYLKRKIAAFPDARIAGPLMPCWPNRLFGDATHLNAVGAALYSQFVAQTLLPDVTATGRGAQVSER